MRSHGLDSLIYVQRLQGFYTSSRKLRAGSSSGRERGPSAWFNKALSMFL